MFMVGKCIKYLRKQNNYKQETLAKIIGLEKSSLSSYEIERRDITFKMMERLAKSCNYEIIFRSDVLNDEFKVTDINRKDV
jgi:transcriptional regulator with XRE-family HTH domain